MPVEQHGGVSLGFTKDPSGKGEFSQEYAQSIDFKRDEFAALIQQKGYPVLWEKAAVCPDRQGSSGFAPKDHNVACEFCDGTGFVYFGAEEATMLVTGISMQESYFVYGRWDEGNISVTGMPEFQMGYWDRLTMRKASARFTEIIQRRTDGLSAGDVLKYAPLEVLYLAWKDREGVLRVGVKDTDFKVQANTVLWQTGGAHPDPKDCYTIVYAFRPRYLVISLPHQYRESQIRGEIYEFPVQVSAKLDYLIRDESRDSGVLRVESPFGT